MQWERGEWKMSRKCTKRKNALCNVNETKNDNYHELLSDEDYEIEDEPECNMELDKMCIVILNRKHSIYMCDERVINNF